MRWIIVFLFLYFIPLIVLFKNYNNIKRTFIYASMYTVLVTTIVITNATNVIAFFCFMNFPPHLY